MSNKGGFFEAQAWGQSGNMDMSYLGKTLILFGTILICIGLLLVFTNKIPFLGKLPGDVLLQRKNFTLYFPLATSVLLSLALSLIFWLWQKK